MDRHPAVFRIKLQCTQASNCLYAFRRHYPRDHRQTFNHGLQSRQDCHIRAI